MCRTLCLMNVTRNEKKMILLLIEFFSMINAAVKYDMSYVHQLLLNLFDKCNISIYLDYLTIFKSLF